VTKPKFIIDPHKGVGPFRFGMTPSEVLAAGGETPPKRSDDRKEGRELMEYYLGGLIQILYDTSERVGAVQFFGDPIEEVVYPPDVPIAQPYPDLLAWARSLDPALKEDGGFQSEALGLSVRDPNDPEDSPFPESVYIFRPGYNQEMARWIEEFEERNQK
jgi:hypothetical protein